MKKEDIRVILVMGKSGSGKQPRIDCLSDEFGFYQISTGTLFRDRIGLFNGVGYSSSLKNIYDESVNEFKSNDEIINILANNSKHPEKIIPEKQASIVLGAKAKYYVESGLFCPDALTNDIFKHAFEVYFKAPQEKCGSKKRGVILDGFPRTASQLEFLVQLLSSHSLKIDFVLEVVLDDETIVKRTTGRRICPGCQGVYHLMFIPPRDGKYCTKCEGDVVVKQRADDSTEDLLRKRLAEFQEKVVPVIELLHNTYRVPFVTVSGNLPDPSRTAVKKDVMNNVSVLFGAMEDIDDAPTPTNNLTKYVSYLSHYGVIAPIIQDNKRLIHVPSASSYPSLSTLHSTSSSSPGPPASPPTFPSYHPIYHPTSSSSSSSYTSSVSVKLVEHSDGGSSESK